MEYNQFIESSLSKIRDSREQLLKTKIVGEKDPFPSTPSNIYIELVVEKDGNQRKIEQWNFISRSNNLLESEFADSEDSQLDSIEVRKKSCFEILDEKLMQFSPKFLIKLLKPHKILIKLKVGQDDLTPFIEESSYLIEIYDYEGSNYNTHLSLKTIHNQLPREARASDLISSGSEFQQLIDEEFLKEIQRERLAKMEEPEEYNSFQIKAKEQNKLEQISIKHVQSRQEQHFVGDGEEQAMQQKIPVKNSSITISDPALELLQETRYLIAMNEFEGWTLNQFLQSLE